MQIPRCNQITIVGTGLLGGSIGLALRYAGFTGKIIGVARSESTRRAALEHHCIDQAGEDPVASVIDSDLIILCTPVGTIPGLFDQLAEHVDPQAVITDVGSTKHSIVQAAHAKLKHPGRFVGSHPMAGSETTGPENARADLFTGKPVIVTPDAHTDADAVEQVETLWRALGMHVTRAGAKEHDQMVAHISHLPHALAVLLVIAAEEGGGLEVASTGFTDTTRIAGGDPELWADIFLDNAEPVVEALDLSMKLTKGLRDVIARGDREHLLKILSQAQRVRQQWLEENQERNRHAV